MVKLLFCLYYLDTLLNGKAAIPPILFGHTLLFCLYYLDTPLNGKAAILPILFGHTTHGKAAILKLLFYLDTLLYIIWTHYSMVKLLFCLYYLDALLNGKAAILPILFGRTTQW